MKENLKITSLKLFPPFSIGCDTNPAATSYEFVVTDATGIELGRPNQKVPKLILSALAEAPNIVPADYTIAVTASDGKDDGETSRATFTVEKTGIVNFKLIDAAAEKPPVTPPTPTPAPAPTKPADTTAGSAIAEKLLQEKIAALELEKGKLATELSTASASASVKANEANTLRDQLTAKEREAAKVKADADTAAVTSQATLTNLQGLLDKATLDAKVAKEARDRAEVKTLAATDAAASKTKWVRIWMWIAIGAAVAAIACGIYHWLIAPSKAAVAPISSPARTNDTRKVVAPPVPALKTNSPAANTGTNNGETNITAVVTPTNAPTAGITPLSEIADLRKLVVEIMKERNNQATEVPQVARKQPQFNGVYGNSNSNSGNFSGNSDYAQVAGRDLNLNFYQINGASTNAATKSVKVPGKDSGEKLPHGCVRKIHLSLPKDKLDSETFGKVSTPIRQGDYVLVTLPEGNQGWRVKVHVTNPVSQLKIWRDGIPYEIQEGHVYDPNVDNGYVRTYEIVLRPGASPGMVDVEFSRGPL